MSETQKKLFRTESMSTTAAMRRLRRERLKKEMPWLFERGKLIAGPSDPVLQMSLERLNVTSVVSVVWKYRCPKCAGSGHLWRFVGKDGVITFQVRCANNTPTRPKCDFALPETPVAKAQDAVSTWRLALALQK